MKKRTSLFLIFIAFFGISFFSCKLKIEEEDLLDRPGVNVTNKQVTLIIPKTSKDTDYVNVYRRDRDNDKVINIGILFHPEALLNDGKNYCYIDTLVKVNHSYDYRVRYRTDGKYYYSDWSDTIDIKSGDDAYAESKVLTYQSNGTKLIYERSDCSLTINGTITDPEITDFDTEFTPMLIVASGSSSQAFELTSIANNDKIYLRSFLPKKYLDKKITIKGIVGQKTNYVDPSKPVSNRDIISIIWTAPTTLEIVGAASDKTIYVASQSGANGFDYSRSAQKNEFDF